jgi:NAD(P)-dependent dehydrogenase (short-subunit alcohol dehydrogenase family)
MNLDLKDKKVFISGSTKGIGFETAKLFLEEGSIVIINGRTKEGVESALNRLNNKNVSGISADFLNNAQIDELINKIPNDIDIIINNVGIFRGKDFYNETIKDWQDHFEVNLMSGVKLCKHFLPNMLKKKLG